MKAPHGGLQLVDRGLVGLDLVAQAGERLPEVLRLIGARDTQIDRKPGFLIRSRHVSPAQYPRDRLARRLQLRLDSPEFAKQHDRPCRAAHEFRLVPAALLEQRSQELRR
ncbi:hypothetical protein [Sorangium sp. So ce542]|uniref:hypothetical protein n=1 Tax=Sorangium sp. So ce542 TaxID=3133316 RepID=UPI003F61C3BB